MIILAVALLLFGKRIPELMGGLGKGIKSFKKEISEETQTSTDQSQSAEPLKQKEHV